MEWVVGQWVDYRGEPAKIEKIDNALTVRFANGSSIRLCLDTEFVKPFQWQVGKTYRTTLEGVTMRVESIADACIIASSQPDELLRCDARTGMVIGLQRMDGVPHLLPCLADEPSEHEPTLTERFRVEQYGNRWLVRDNQTGLIARFTTHGNATGAVEMMKNGDMTWSWSEDDEDDVDDVQEPPLPSRYHRRIKGVVIDLYDIAEAYGLQGHAEFHAVKKILMAGNRGYKSREQDLAEAEQSIQRARELAKGGE